ncbi:MAG: ABC transporter ATP-binding protein [Gammaproteobacteria bacterium]|nr:ABC transporter ATP-binding protein [Gammaproteobacteria bacterium]
MINAEELTRRYGETLAVDSVSFSIGSGEIVGLLGHNGAGKTTIMKMLTGYLEPSGGRVSVDGTDVADAPEAVQQQLGYLPENCPVYPEMTVVGYLDYVAGLRHVEDRAAALREVLTATDLTDRAFDAIGTLSRGYQQRVGVAQAIVHRPQLLILDEPTNGLDPSQTQQMRDLIRRLAEHATVILSTHIMQEVDAVCDRVMILRAGRLALDERLDDLQRSERVVLYTDAAQDDVEAAVSGFAAVTREDGAYAFDGVADADSRAELARRLIAAGVAVHGLAAEQRDLETVFREVSEGGQREAEDAS